MNIQTKKSLLATIIGLSAAAGGMQQAYGQDGEAATAQGRIDEIIVTAQKREQNLQDTPLAITAITGDTLQARGIDSGQDLQLLVPGLTIVNSTTTSPHVTIRGVGMDNFLVGGDPGVPIHIDGHYIQDASYILRDLFDVERVEVLRGPQGTLYGRNAAGGSVNIITKRPTENFEASLSADVGNYDKRLLQAVISGPFTDKLRSRLAIADEDRDGYVENLVGENIDSSNYTSIRAMLEYDLTEDIQLTLSAYKEDDSGVTVSARNIKEFPTQISFINYFALNNAGSNITASDPWTVRSGREGRERNESSITQGVAVDVDWDMGNILFRSLSAYNDSEGIYQHLDLDGSDVVARLDISGNTSYETFTQELQLLSNNEGSLQWILGAFYYTENASYDEDLSVDNLLVVGGPDTIVETRPDVDAEALGVFGQFEYSINEKLEVIAGLRYNKDKKALFSTFLLPDFGIVGPNGEPIVLVDDSEDWTQVTGKLGMNYHIDEDVMLYASYSTGYKSGGYNIFQATPYNEEVIAAYELGLKSLWSDRKVQTNVSAFYYDYTDKQELGRTPLGIAEILNAGEATVWGLELEVSARPISSLLIDASVGYLNTEYEDFNSIDNIINPALGFQDLAGNELVHAPEWKLALGLQHEWTLGEMGQLVARVDISWVDEQFSRPFNLEEDHVDSYNRTNAQLRWDSQDELWQAALSVQNLTDEDTIDNKIPSEGGALLLATYLPPRTYALRITRRF